ncbi:head maturation protease, ClpP-related [Achromobacter anxifer]
MAKKGNFYSIIPSMKAGESVVELRIYDDIGFWGKTAAEFADELDAVAASATKIIVAINSGGGSVYDAFAMYNALRRYPGRTVGRVDGVAASAATLPLIACDVIEMPENAQIMIHEPTTAAWGTVAELKASVSQMENIIESVIAAYARRSGQPPEKIVEMMGATTWMSAFEARALGFCDLIEESVEIAMSTNSRELLSRFPNLPEPLQRFVEGEGTAGPAMVAPDPVDPTPADPEPIDPLPTDPTLADPAPADPDRVASPQPAADPEPPAPDPTASALAGRVYAACRSEGIPQLAEGVLMSGALESQAAADLRVAQAKEIAGVCLAARLPDKAADFVSAGLGVEQVRARLFDQLLAGEADPINNRQATNSSAPKQSGPNPQAIYAKRKALSAN